MIAAQCGAEIEDIQLCTCGQSASHPYCDKSHLLVNAATGRQFSPVALAALQKHAAETKTDGLSTHDLLVVHAAARRCASGRRPKLADALVHNRALLAEARRADVEKLVVSAKDASDVSSLCQDPLCDRQSTVPDHAPSSLSSSSSSLSNARHRHRRHRRHHQAPATTTTTTTTPPPLVSTSDIEDTVEDPQAVLQRSANNEHQVTPVFSWRRMRKRDLLAVTRSELAQHTTRDSCWVAVGSNVYDVTDYLDQHKSGAHTILKHAGTDITHHVQFHSSAMMKLLKKHYLIGTLVADANDDEKQQTCAIV